MEMESETAVVTYPKTSSFRPLVCANCKECCGKQYVTTQAQFDVLRYRLGSFLSDTTSTITEKEVFSLPNTLDIQKKLDAVVNHVLNLDAQFTRLEKAQRAAEALTTRQLVQPPPTVTNVAKSMAAHATALHSQAQVNGQMDPREDQAAGVVAEVSLTSPVGSEHQQDPQMRALKPTAQHQHQQRRPSHQAKSQPPGFAEQDQPQPIQPDQLQFSLPSQRQAQKQLAQNQRQASKQQMIAPQPSRNPSQLRLHAQDQQQALQRQVQHNQAMSMAQQVPHSAALSIPAGHSYVVGYAGSAPSGIMAAGPMVPSGPSMPTGYFGGPTGFVPGYGMPYIPGSQAQAVYSGFKPPMSAGMAPPVGSSVAQMQVNIPATSLGPSNSSIAQDNAMHTRGTLESGGNPLDSTKRSIGPGSVSTVPSKNQRLSISSTAKKPVVEVYELSD